MALSSPRRASSVATVLIVSGAAGSGASANTYWTFTDLSHMSWRVTYMTDFDQRRMGQASPPIFGLPENGGMYCVPTATLNLAAYIASHGVPWLPPLVQNWHGPSAFAYSTATVYIAQLGVMMNTHPTDGTGGLGWTNGARAWFPSSHFDVEEYFTSASYSPLSFDLFAFGFNGGLPAIAYGRYQEPFTNTLGARGGGHAVTLSRIGINGSEKEVWYRDPADDSANLMTQSLAKHRVLPVVDRSFTIGFNGPQQTRLELITGLTDGVRRVIDGAVVVYPKFCLTNNDPNLILTYTPLPLRPALGPVSAGVSAPNLIDFAYRPGSRHIIAYLAAVPGMEPSLRVINRITGQNQQIAILGVPKRLVFGRQRQLYVLDGRQIRCYDLSLPNPFQFFVTVPLDIGTVDALAYDDMTDRLFVLSAADRLVLRYPPGLIGPAGPTTHVFPVGTPLAGTPSIATGPDGAIWVTGSSNNVIERFRLHPTTGALQPGGMIEGPGVVSPRGLQVGDDGHVFFSSGGFIKEYMMDKHENWVENKDSMFAGVPGGSRLVLSRSRTNFDPATMSGPAFNNVLNPESASAPLAPDCAGDADADDDVDFFDLNYVLTDYGQVATWLSGDVDGDGDCDFLDLNLVLSRFGVVCN